MTLPASQQHALDAIDDVLDGIFFRNNPSLAVAAMIAIEPGGDSLFQRGARLGNVEAKQFHVQAPCLIKADYAV